jgi:hypothetical protein
MGGYDRGKNWWWDYFKDELFSIFKNVKGSITLSNGYSETQIKLDPKIKASKIYVAVVAENIPICAGDIDKVGAIQNSDNSFILYADIKSNAATVYWLVDINDDK